jgi:hypothetical protein
MLMTSLQVKANEKKVYREVVQKAKEISAK